MKIAVLIGGACVVAAGIVAAVTFPFKGQMEPDTLEDRQIAYCEPGMLFRSEATPA